MKSGGRDARVGRAQAAAEKLSGRTHLLGADRVGRAMPTWQAGLRLLNELVETAKSDAMPPRAGDAARELLGSVEEEVA